MERDVEIMEIILKLDFQFQELASVKDDLLTVGRCGKYAKKLDTVLSKLNLIIEDMEENAK